MKYIGEFNDINEITYKVEIETPTEGEDETLLMSGEPVIISYESEDEQAYKPYKCSTATISFYLTEANFDLIDAFANRVKVTIYKENQVIWCGYATPNAYSQSYEDYFDTFELECQDGVSTLQYYDYEYIPQYCEYYYEEPTVEHPYDFIHWQDGITTHNKANNFFHLIMMMNEKLGGMYKNIYSLIIGSYYIQICRISLCHEVYLYHLTILQKSTTLDNLFLQHLHKYI